MRFKFASALLAFGFAVLVTAQAPQNDIPIDIANIESDVIRKLNAACATRETTSCLKLKMLSYMNKLLKKASIELSEDVVVTQTAEVPVFVSSPRELVDQDQDSQLFSLVTSKARSFLQSRELHWKLLPDAQVVVSTGRDLANLNVKLDVDTARAAETARTKIKGLFALAAAGIAKIGVIAALKFAALVALVLKALVVSKLALALAVIVGLSRLLSQQHAVTYEVVSHPHISHSSGIVGSADNHHDTHHDSYSSSVGYGRSGANADNLAYKAHVPK